MDFDIKKWTSCLDNLESADEIGKDLLKAASQSILHVPPRHQVAVRLLKDYDNCTTRTREIFGQLFDKMDLANKDLFNHLLELSVAIGHFRHVQIIYHIESPRDLIESNPNHTPPFAKSKWYDLEPLLPEAGTIGWKHILTLGLMDERRLDQPCVKLLEVKLKFMLCASTLPRFNGFSDIIRKNGERVTEKLIERLLVYSNNDDEMMNLNTNLFKCMMPFMNDEQRIAIIEAVVRDVLKPKFQGVDSCKHSKSVIQECFSESRLQEVVIKKMIEHLQFNVIRRKRRHSVEATEENLDITFESLIADIINGQDSAEVLSKLTDVEVSSKKLQTVYLNNWVEILIATMAKKTLTPKSSNMLISACSVIISTTSNQISADLIRNISILMTETIDQTGQRKLEKFFKHCGPDFLIKLTEILAAKTDLLNDLDSPMTMFYKSYYARHMRFCAMKGYHKDAEKFSQFVKFICSHDNLDKGKSHLLEYICLTELSEFLEYLKSKGGNKLLDLYVSYGKSISKKLYKFIKTHQITDGLEEPTNGSNNSTDGDRNQAAVIEALVCVLKIAMDSQDQDMSDTFGDMMSRLYKQMCSRIKNLIDKVKSGSHIHSIPLDNHLAKLMSLYADHKSSIQPYICFDLNKEISDSLMFERSNEDNLNGVLIKSKKKTCYKEMKNKLEDLQSRAEKFQHVYQTLINKQYNLIVEQNISQIDDIHREEYCFKKYMNSMKAIGDVSSILLGHCDTDMYELILENITQELEQCDSLNHPKVIYLLLILESLVPKHSKETSKFTSFRDKLPRISCSLIRISKSVELGPSVHSFTNSGAHRSNGGIQCCTYSNCIKIYTLIFIRYPPKITNPLITEAMQLCVNANLERYAKYSTRLHKLFIQLASSIAGLLKAICIGCKEDVLKSAMPIYLSVFSLLIRCIILASDRLKLDDLTKASQQQQLNGNGNGELPMDLDDPEPHNIPEACKIYEANLEYLARDVGRMMNNLSFLEVRLIDYAPHLITAYIKDTQRASCPEFVKKHLDEGVFRIFNLVDAHQKGRQEEIIEAGVQRKTIAAKASGSLFEMIHARLNQASREIFKDMHESYNRFHRYLGKC